MQTKKGIAMLIVLVIIMSAAGIAVVLKNNSQPGVAMESYNLLLLESENNDDPKLKSCDTLLRFETPMANLGQMKLMQKKEIQFQFVNASSAPVIIPKVMTTCGCTSANWDRSPVMPGVRSEIIVTFEAQEKGIFFKKLFVYVAGVSSPLELAIKGVVK